MPPQANPQDWFGDFGVDEALIQKALSAASAYGADDADLYFEHTTSTSVALSDKKVNRVHTSTVLGVGIRVVIGDQVGYTFTENLSLNSVLSAARTASEIARGGKPFSPRTAHPSSYLTTTPSTDCGPTWTSEPACPWYVSGSRGPLKQTPACNGCKSTSLTPTSAC